MAKFLSFLLCFGIFIFLMFTKEMVTDLRALGSQPTSTPQVVVVEKLVEPLKVDFSKHDIKKDSTYQNAIDFANSEIKKTPKRKLYDKQKVINAINKHLDGGRLTGKGEQFYKAFEDHKVSAIMMASIAYFESRVEVNGKWIAGLSDLTFRLNNFCGMNRRTGFPYEGRYAKYPSIDVAIDDMGFWLRKNYLDKGLKDIPSIGRKYCPVSDKDNGKHGMDNSKWAQAVEKKFKEIKKDVLGGNKLD